MDREIAAEQIDVMREECLMLQHLRETPGYAWMMEQLQNTLVAKTTEIIKPPTVMADEQSRTYLAGEAKALTYCINLISQTLTGKEASIRVLQQSVDMDDYNEES